MGAMLGSAFGQAAHAALPQLTAPSGAYALVGMGAVFAGAARAPITAVLIIFELTGEYTIILPLMFAIVLATATSRRLSGDTIYTLKLRRRGVQVDRPRVVSVMRTVPVAAAMRALPEPLAADAPLAAVLARFRRDECVPVVGPDGELAGVISALDVEEQALDGDTEPTAGQIAHAPRELHADDVLEDAVRALSLSDDAGLPVLEPGGHGVAGWVTHRDILRAYHDERERLSPRSVDVPARATPVKPA